jgi:hypothetical protein
MQSRIPKNGLAILIGQWWESFFAHQPLHARDLFSPLFERPESGIRHSVRDAVTAERLKMAG